MNLSHFSRKPIDRLGPTAQDAEFLGGKPNGLWVSVDGEDDWPRWCRENYYDGCGPYCYRVHMHGLDRVLVLKTVDDLRGFGAMHGTGRFGYIDWAAVAKNVAGIIIAPYQWDARLDLHWYYGWDCASGCIWDPSVIERLEVLT